MTSMILGVILFTTLILLLSLFVLQVRTWLFPAEDVLLTINGVQSVHVRSGRKLLQTLNDEGINIPSSCAGAGTCGLCKVAITDGFGPLLSTEAAQLTAVDQQRHMRLACQVPVRNDLSITVPQEILHAEKWQTIVHSTTSLSPLIREIVLSMPENKTLEFWPGAYVQIYSTPYSLDFSDFRIDKDCQTAWDKLDVSSLHAGSKIPVSRAYSLANRPGDRHQIVLLIRLALPPPGKPSSIPPGIVSSWLFNLRSGDTVEVAGPFGEFSLQENSRDMVLIGGGVGMAPLRSIIHAELASNRTRAVSFFYGARSQNDIFYSSEFDELAQSHHRFSWLTALSEPGQVLEWNGPTGFIHEVFKSEYLKHRAHPERCDYYLCGPPLMQKAVLAVLEDAGVSRASVFADVFGE